MIAIRQDDVRLVMIRAELLHGLPELTGAQINAAAWLALVAMERFPPPKPPDVLEPLRGWIRRRGRRLTA